MGPNPTLFRDLTIVFVAATVGGLIVRRLGLPLIVGYVLGGIAISPFTPGYHLSDLVTFQTLAEVGVAMLMFSIGVEFSLNDLLELKWVAVGGGTLGIGASVILAIFLARPFGWTVLQGFVIGTIVSVASTVVLATTMEQRGETSTTAGRVKISITLFEDLAIVLITAIIPTLSGEEGGQLKAVLWTLAKALILMLPLAVLAVKVIPLILARVKGFGNSELFRLLAIAICLGTAELSHVVGFSLALGAFLAGVSISGSRELHEEYATVLPVRDAFVALFFVSLGTLVQPKMLMHDLPLLGIMLLLIIPGKFLIWGVVVRLFGYSNSTAIAVAVSLTQIGELSFVVAQAGLSAHIIGENVFSATLAASIISIVANVFLMRLLPVAAASAKAASSDSEPAIIAGK